MSFILGASTASLADFALDAALSQICDLGFAGVEILAFAGARHSIGKVPGAWLCDVSQTDSLRAQLSGFACIATHAPFIDLSIFTYNAWIRRESFGQIRAAIRGTARLGGQW